MTHFTHTDRLTDLIYAGAVCPECKTRSHSVRSIRPPVFHCATCWKVFEVVETAPATDPQDERFAEAFREPEL